MIFNVSEYAAFQEKQLENEKVEIKTALSNLQKIKNNLYTKTIKYPEYKEAFDYVDSLFPLSKVKELVVYFVDGTYLKHIGYGGICGFHSVLTNEIVIAKSVEILDDCVGIIGKITKDETLVHELLHYCYAIEKDSSSLKGITEEFAYGWSVGYLHNKGYSDEYIITNIFLPYLTTEAAGKAFMDVLYEDNITYEAFTQIKGWKQNDWIEKNRNRIMAKQIDIGYRVGEEIIDIYTKKIKNHLPSNSQITLTRFEMMNFDS